jgi:hypothetical protein
MGTTTSGKRDLVKGLLFSREEIIEELRDLPNFLFKREMVEYIADRLCSRCPKGLFEELIKAKDEKIAELTEEIKRISNAFQTQFRNDLDDLLDDYCLGADKCEEDMGLKYQKFFGKYAPKGNQTLLMTEEEIHNCICDGFMQSAEYVFIGVIQLRKDYIRAIARVLANKIPKQADSDLLKAKDEEIARIKKSWHKKQDELEILQAEYHDLEKAFDVFDVLISAIEALFEVDYDEADTKEEGTERIRTAVEAKLDEIDQLRAENKELQTWVNHYKQKTLKYEARLVNDKNVVHKVKIPQFVADVLDNFTGTRQLSYFYSDTRSAISPQFDKWVQANYNNQNLLARAWLDGYEIEEEKPSEKRYYVYLKFESGGHIILVKGSSGTEFLDTSEAIEKPDHLKQFKKSELAEVMGGKLYKLIPYDDMDDEQAMRADGWELVNGGYDWEWINPLIELVEVCDD